MEATDRAMAVKSNSPSSPREELANAHMHPRSETDMTAGAPCDVEGVGVVPATRITVRRTKKHQDLFTFRDLDVAYADRPCRGAEEGLDRDSNLTASSKAARASN